MPSRVCPPDSAWSAQHILGPSSFDGIEAARSCRAGCPASRPEGTTPVDNTPSTPTRLGRPCPTPVLAPARDARVVRIHRRLPCYLQRDARYFRAATCRETTFTNAAPPKGFNVAPPVPRSTFSSSFLLSWVLAVLGPMGRSLNRHVELAISSIVCIPAH